MPSKKETALAALATALGGVAGVTFERNLDLATQDENLGGADKWVVLYDGDPGEPTVLLSPTTYVYEHVAEIEVLVTRSAPAADVDVEFDAVLVAISTAVNADTTLGGTVDLVELGQPPEPDVEAAGGKSSKGCVIPATLMYDTTDPLN